MHASGRNVRGIPTLHEYIWHSCGKCALRAPESPLTYTFDLFITGIEVQRDWSHYTRGGENIPVKSLPIYFEKCVLLFYLV